jgi:hypothetical protein
VGDPGEGAADVIVSSEDSEMGFVAVRARVGYRRGDGVAVLGHDVAEALGVDSGAMVTVSPLRFEPDRVKPPAIPTIHLRDELKRKRPDVSGRELAALPFGEVAGIVQDKLDEILDSLRE